MMRFAIFIVILCSIPPLAVADSVYVSDSLRVGVRPQPNNSTTPYGVVVTGMRLDVLQHSGDYIKIRNDKGLEGWIKDTYVIPNKPAKLVLAQIQSQQAKLKQQLAAQTKTIKNADLQVQQMAQEVQKLKSDNADLRQRIALTQGGRSESVLRYQITYLVVLLLLGFGGFVSGVRWYRKRAMQRLASVRA